MIQIGSFNEALEALARYIPLTKQITGRDITLERMAVLMNVLGNPQDSLKVIHVAGTSGKTSTSYFIASFLKIGGRRVGLTVSPHVDSVTERLQVDMEPLTEADFTLAVSEAVSIVDGAGVEPTYFEFMVGLAYWYFRKIGVDYVVAETGLGGEQDATNIAKQSDKVCVITDIGLDHMHILGDTIEAIASQKSGIIHTGNTVFMNHQSEEVVGSIDSRCKQVGAQLHVIKPDISKQVQLPLFQRRNFGLASEVYEHLVEHDGLPRLDDSQLAEVARTYIPARMDIAQIGKMRIIMDGAHNQQKMNAFVGSFREMHPGVKVPVVLSLKQGKELESVLPLLVPITEELILTSFNLGEGIPVPSIDPDELAQAARELGFSRVEVRPEPEDAYSYLLKSGKELGIVTGSFYLIFQLRQLRKELRQHGS